MEYEVLEKANKEMKTIDVKGKAYAPVNERMRIFRKYFPNYSLETEIINIDNVSCTLKAVIKNENGVVMATGLANEVNGSTYINKTSYVENAETSAWGRALGNLGIGIDGSICSADELVNAINNQNKKPQNDIKFGEVKQGQDITKDYATEDQINIITGLFNTLGKSEEIKKTLNKLYKVDSFDLLERKDADSLIKKLEEKVGK